MRIIFLILVLISLCPNLLDTGNGSAKNNRENSLVLKALREVNPEDIGNTILQLESFQNRFTWSNQWRSARWIANQFGYCGLEVNLDTYEFRGKVWPNVIARKEGVEESKGIVMVIAHLDSISDHPELMAPGADDNASGVAVLLEVARILEDIPLDCTIMFCVFSNEEVGTAGSKSFAGEARESEMNILTVINLDILGYNKPGNPMYLDAIQAHSSPKRKVKALVRMLGNYATGFMEGPDIVKVAGREADRALVQSTSRVLRQYASLKTKELISDDCA
jgi:hypothetical protein